MRWTLQERVGKDMEQILLLIALVAMFTILGFLATYSVGHDGWRDATGSSSLNEADKRSKIDFSKAVRDSIRNAKPIHIKTPEERERFDRSDYKIRNAEWIVMTRGGRNKGRYKR